MSKQKPKKATMKEVTDTIDQMLSNMSWLKNNLDMVGKLFDLYVESKGDTETFKAFLEERQEDYEKKQADAVKKDAAKKEQENEQSTDEPVDDKDSGDSDGDKK